MAMLALILIGSGAASPGEDARSGPRVLTVEDILKLSIPAADHQIPYGDDPQEFGELRLPKGPGPYPVAIVIHGGCWLSEYNLHHIASFSAALTGLGIATWSLEYRRVGNAGGGWPGTFADIARGSDYLRVLARDYPLDLGRIVAVGHSAGGQLALWLAARHRLRRDSPLFLGEPLRLGGVVSLAGVVDLRRALEEQVCQDSVQKLLGGPPAEVGERYEQASPAELLPLGIPQRILHGSLDKIVPLGQGRDYVAAAKSRGDDARLTLVRDAGHFEFVVPESVSWPVVREAVLSLLGIAGHN